MREGRKAGYKTINKADYIPSALHQLSLCFRLDLYQKKRPFSNFYHWIRQDVFLQSEQFVFIAHIFFLLKNMEIYHL